MKKIKYHKSLKSLGSSKIDLFHHAFLLHWTKKWIIKHFHYLSSRQLKISKLTFLVRSLKGLLWWLNLSLNVVIDVLRFKPK